jgi:hypothetical protein
VSHQTRLDDIEDESARPCAAFGRRRARRLRAPKVMVHKYYTVNDRLYFVLDADMDSDIYWVENSETEFTMWVTGTYLREEVTWVARNRRS